MAISAVFFGDSWGDNSVHTDELNHIDDYTEKIQDKCGY